MRPDVSVIIPALNVADTLGLQLAALLAQECEEAYEVIVADNGSTDETHQVALAHGARVVDASSRRGINHARNVGARNAHGSLLLFCDGDDLVFPEWLQVMTDGLRSAEAVGGTVVRVREEEWGDADYIRLLRQHGSKPSDQPLGAADQFMPFPVGANCGVRRKGWEILGGFNEDYDGGGSDEVEFFWRLQLGGKQLAFVDAPLLYRVRSDPRSRRRKAYRTAREAAHIHRDFRRHGMPRRSTSMALRSYAWLATHLPGAFVMASAREEWWDVAARQVGRLVGSVRYRVFFP